MDDSGRRGVPRAAIVALAGRRIDAAGATPPRFPSENVDVVSHRLRRLFETEAAQVVVSSAACGADLLALTIAGTLGIQRHVILPFDRQRFRQTSVIDRPGDWGSMYDRVLEELEATRDVETLEPHGSETAAYAAVNRAILDHTVVIARARDAEAIAARVWEGASRGDDDLTATFGQEAAGHGLRVVEVRTTVD